MQRAADFVVVGGGVVGLATAHTLKQRLPDASVVVLAKEKDLGAHASGRNSGVVHAGIYYPPGTLKAKLCVEGARRMRSFCEDRKLPLKRFGKVIVPVDDSELPMIDMLADRARANGAEIEVL